MQLVIRINQHKKIDFFLNLLQEFDFVEVLEVKEETSISPQQKALLDSRLDRIERGEGTFKNWNEIKKKYEPI